MWVCCFDIWRWQECLWFYWLPTSIQRSTTCWAKFLWKSTKNHAVRAFCLRTICWCSRRVFVAQMRMALSGCRIMTYMACFCIPRSKVKTNFYSTAIPSLLYNITEEILQQNSFLFLYTVWDISFSVCNISCSISCYVCNVSYALCYISCSACVMVSQLTSVWYAKVLLVWRICMCVCACVWFQQPVEVKSSLLKHQCGFM